MGKLTKEILNLIRTMDDLCQVMHEDIEAKFTKADHARKLELVRIRDDLSVLEKSGHQMRGESLEAKLDEVGVRLKRLYRSHS